MKNKILAGVICFMFMFSIVGVFMPQQAEAFKQAPTPDYASFDVLLDMPGYFNVQYYDYTGRSANRAESFGSTRGEPIIQKAERGSYNEEHLGTGWFVGDQRTMPEGMNKASKIWGYFKAPQTGTYKFGSYSDDGAYGYILIGGEREDFVNDWRIAPPQYRSNNRTFQLEQGIFYPIYLEWFEGMPTQTASVPSYQVNGSDWNDITIEIYPSRTNTPGEIAEEYFEPPTEPSEESDTPDTPQTSFSDLDPGHWAHDNIMDMVERGILSGYPDGTFRPNNVVTRAEFATIMVKALELQAARPASPTFTDVGTDHWAFEDVESAKDYLTGYQDRRTGELSFVPSGDAVREDVAVAIVKAQGYGDERANLSYLNQFSDQGEISDALRDHVAIAVEKGYMQGTDIGFEPQKPLTRAEASTLLLRIIQAELEKVTL